MKIFKKFIISITVLTLLLAVTFAILNTLFPLEKIAVSQSKILYDKNGEIISMKLSDDGYWKYSADEIPPLIKKSVINFEDKYFYNHFGVNPFSIIRAFFHNLTHDNKIGASTITMQVARIIEPKKRSYKNKIIEIFRAFQLELNYSKDEILNIYFNIAPYGGNIVGIKAASKFYFDKDLDELSISQIALLSIVPKNPNENRLDKNKNLNALKNRVLKELLDDKIIDESAYKRALKESFTPKRYDAKNRAFHYSNLAFKNGIISSNLDLNLQNEIENIIKKEMINFNKFDLFNASAVVIDNLKMEVVAYVGSHDLKSKDGFNDGVMAKRSVGSTLKPFIYALALENGLITPKQNLIDAEIYLGDYAPKNYTKDFLGEISATDALIFSLNTPAVFLNSNLGENSLYELLKKANLKVKEKSFFGESIALGSVPLNLLELTHLYTIFANEGELLPLEIAGEIKGEKITLLSKQSSFLVSQMLLQTPRSYLNSVWQSTVDMPLIAFKTGTSANWIDLHTIAFNKNYTVGVWLGNFNSKPTSGLTGGDSSAKIVFEIFRYLNKRKNLEFISKPEGISKKNICLDSFVFKECKNLQKDFVIDGVSLVDKCTLITNEQINYLLKNAFITSDDLKQSPCFGYFKDIKPLIAYPANRSKMSSFYGKINTKCISFLGDEVYIKVDDEKYEKFRSGSEIVLNLSSGFHTIKCLDEYSNLATSEIFLEEL
ncbi:penicillin-binding protein 1C [Campylobacter corcagiensis]|uniref:peptidoglycan glycosyltransferase n=1 Tax=Campylobacter corcagiensis TaxID=1448857 RepID=A0A7M1LHZ1_9BACT|nr:penicillin-binding protein 1C [Campylobacter corcagiensis]QKF64721.1 penicillin-binding protein 1C [Campylobacter corcagiensis]QOQ87115.1 penicillin-binding protein 1C [Campylobacter corcagiensis]